jgi:hypothetical protein
MKDALEKLRKDQVRFISALLDYAAKQRTWPPEFCPQDIIKILGVTETELNIMRNNAGGCCTYIGPDRYRINVDHCLLLREQLEQRKLISLNWLLIILTLFILVVACITLVLMVFPPIQNSIWNSEKIQNDIKNKQGTGDQHKKQDAPASPGGTVEINKH